MGLRRNPLVSVRALVSDRFASFPAHRDILKLSRGGPNLLGGHAQLIDPMCALGFDRARAESSSIDHRARRQEMGLGSRRWWLLALVECRQRRASCGCSAGQRSLSRHGGGAFARVRLHCQIWSARASASCGPARRLQTAAHICCPQFVRESAAAFSEGRAFLRRNGGAHLANRAQVASCPARSVSAANQPRWPICTGPSDDETIILTQPAQPAATGKCPREDLGVVFLIHVFELPPRPRPITFAPWVIGRWPRPQLKREQPPMQAPRSGSWSLQWLRLRMRLRMRLRSGPNSGLWPDGILTKCATRSTP